MTMFKTATLATITLVAATSAASAATDRIDRMQERQDRRIENGRMSGALTYREGRQLRREQRFIRKLEEILRESGGRLDRAERKVLIQLLRRASRNIRDEKHDNQRRYGYIPRVGR